MGVVFDDATVLVGSRVVAPRANFKPLGHQQWRFQWIHGQMVHNENDKEMNTNLLTGWLPGKGLVAGVGEFEVLVFTDEVVLPTVVLSKEFSLPVLLQIKRKTN